MNEREEKQYQKMTMTPVSKLVIMLGIPTTISMLITNIYNMADTYFVSHRNCLCIDGDFTSLWIYVWAWSRKSYFKTIRGKKSRKG